MHLLKNTMVTILVLLAGIVLYILPLAAQTKDCSVTFYLGDVEVRSAGTTAWKPAEMGQALKTGDVVRTMVESRAELTLADGTKIEVGEKSIFEVKKVDGDKQQNNFKVLSGKIAADVKKLTKARSEFKMESPVAIAAIRGTKFSMYVKEGQTDISVTEGKIEVKMVKSQQTVALGQNQTITVTDQTFEIKVIQQTPGKDETPPKLNLESPQGAVMLTTNAVEIKGSTEPKAKLKINNEDVAIDKDGKFTKKLEFKQEGVATVTMTATDSAGNELELMVDVTVNISAPEIKAAKSVGDSTAEELCVVSGNVVDKTPDDVIVFSINGEAITLGDGGAFSKTVRLKEGDNVLTLVATDKANHQSKVELKVKKIKGAGTKDTTPPTVAVTSSVGAETQEQTAVISGKITDNYPLEEVKASIKTPDKTEPLALANGMFQYTAMLKEGENKFTITAVDLAGNTASADITITKKSTDTTPPLLTMSTNQLNEWTKDNNLIISGTVQDLNGTGKVFLMINKEKVDLSGPSFRYTYYLTEGKNLISVIASDEAGNVASQELQFFYDRIPPNIIITRPAKGVSEINFPGTPTNQFVEKSFTVTGFIQDPDPSSGLEKVTINGQEVRFRSDGSFEYTLDKDLSGAKIRGGISYDLPLEIKAVDRAGNESVDNSRTINLKW